MSGVFDGAGDAGLPPAPGPDHVMESDVFRAVLPGLWQRQPMPGAPLGHAAFTHPVFGFSAFQMVITPPPGERADTEDFVQRAMESRLTELQSNGHDVTPGRLAFTRKPHGPVGVCDCVLDGRRYGVMAGHGFADLVLVHFLDGDVGQEPAVKAQMLALLDSVEATGPAAPATS